MNRRPLRAKQQLTKILLNRRHVLNPLIENMVKHDPVHVGVQCQG